jgi:hypothetical protein
MKHIILYENFEIEIAEQQKLSGGALMIEPGKTSTIAPGELYISLSRSDSGVAEATISTLKKDKSSKAQLNFTDEKDLIVKIKDGSKEVKGTKMYVSHTKLSGDEGGGTVAAWLKCDEASSSEAIDSFLAHSGSYSDLETGKSVAAKMVTGILQVFKEMQDGAPATLKSMAIVLTNASKLNKNIIPVASDQQKELNKVMLAAVKKFLNPSAEDKG